MVGLAFQPNELLKNIPIPIPITFYMFHKKITEANCLIQCIYNNFY